MAVKPACRVTRKRLNSLLFPRFSAPSHIQSSNIHHSNQSSFSYIDFLSGEMSTAGLDDKVARALHGACAPVRQSLMALGSAFLKEFCEATSVAVILDGLDMTDLEVGHIRALKSVVNEVGTFASSTGRSGEDLAKLFEDTGVWVWSADGTKQWVDGLYEADEIGGKAGRASEITRKLMSDAEYWGHIMVSYLYMGDANDEIQRFFTSMAWPASGIENADVLAALVKLKRAYTALPDAPEIAP
jgi:hypothetical protein